MTRLEEKFARALRHLSTAERATLGDRIDARNAVLVGRLLRLALIAELSGLEADPIHAELQVFADPKATFADLVHARDDAESVLVLLEVLEDEDAARALHAQLATIDAAPRDEHRAVEPRNSWISRLAAQDASTWWLDAVALDALRTQWKTLDVGAVFRAPVVSTPIVLRRTAKPRVDAEVVGMDHDPARTAVERGGVVARMFDGEVVVYALGLRADEEDFPAGLCVARARGGAEDMTVTIAGVAPGRSAAGWWVPLADRAGPQELVVRLAEREETLALDVAR